MLQLYFISAEQQPCGNYIPDYLSLKRGSRSYSLVGSIFMLAFYVHLPVALLIWHCPSGLEDKFPSHPLKSRVYLPKCTSKHLKNVISAPSHWEVWLLLVCAHCVFGLDYKILMWLILSPNLTVAEISLILSPSSSCPTQATRNTQKVFLLSDWTTKSRSAPATFFYH